MPRQSSWGADEDRRLLELHAEGKTQRDCAKIMGWSHGTLQKHSKRLNIRWNGLQMDGPLRRVAEVAERRMSLEERLLQRAHALVDQLESEKFSEIMKGEYGAEGVVELDFVPARSVKDLTASINSLARAHVDIKRLELAHQSTSDFDEYMAMRRREALYNIDVTITNGAPTTGDGNAPKRTGELPDGVLRSPG